MGKWVYVRDDDGDGTPPYPPAPEPISVVSSLPFDVMIDGNTVPVFCNGELVGSGVIHSIGGTVEFTGTLSGDIAGIIEVGSSLSIGYFQAEDGSMIASAHVVQEPDGLD